MKALLQRVVRAEVRVDGRVVGAIGRGLLVYVGVERGDTDRDAAKGSTFRIWLPQNQ